MLYPIRLTRRLALMATTALIVACAPLKIYYKEGVQVARMETDQTDCEISALEKVPKDIRTRYIPPTYTPYQYCDRYGRCYWRQRLVSPGRHVSYDSNGPLRDKVTAQCMAQKGYQLVELPACGSAVTQSVPVHATQVLPRLGPKSCAIRLKSGRWQIVTP
ncbi:hypothetical protein PEL8287_00440 [Roseovarius litorisediminis]|uniref:Lipoprotein n=1 Tax=Roseovarius litorisediminis TaxID=1312363 RepID=A0A1Y5RE18_9RHOB|nr:hypothetical protein [Roseovarius litorisediminis]SLN12714.1 hypothetical protein PEL8287_00440 [Roseovarius litorisediminis]